MTATVSKTSLKKWSYAASNFVALIASGSVLQMLAVFFFRESNSVKDFIEVNPLSASIHIEILQTDLHTFP